MAEGPIIYFEEVGVYNHIPGILHVELKAGVATAVSASEMKAEHLSVAHLRGNIQAFRALSSVIDAAIKAHDKQMTEALNADADKKPDPKPN